ncbi:MAG: ParB/RepB/Spo0J family partition protein [Nitrospiraceae bacterium]|nr:ParB/RepB/Spo0J family partition protein [Nitrospiraceae bacterium]
MNEKVAQIEIDKILPSPYQPRIHFNSEAIEALANSIKDLGIIQPLVVREKNEYFELIAGERRLEALKMLKVETVPAIIKNATNIEAFRMTLAENIQREELNPIEIANAIKQMKEEFNLTDEKVGKLLGISRTQITNYLRILRLPIKIKYAIEDGQISFGHAKSLLALPEKEIMTVFKKIIEKNLSVRDTERIARKEKEIFQLEEILTRIFGTKVKIIGSRTKGKIQISYFSEDELINAVRRLKK